MKVPEGLSRMEQETLCRTSAADKEWDFYTRDPKFRRRMEKRGWPIQADHQGLWSCKIPLKAIIIRSKDSMNRPKRQVTDEERAAIRKRFLKAPLLPRASSGGLTKNEEPPKNG